MVEEKSFFITDLGHLLIWLLLAENVCLISKYIIEYAKYLQVIFIMTAVAELLKFQSIKRKKETMAFNEYWYHFSAVLLMRWGFC